MFTLVDPAVVIVSKTRHSADDESTLGAPRILAAPFSTTTTTPISTALVCSNTRVSNSFWRFSTSARSPLTRTPFPPIPTTITTPHCITPSSSARPALEA